MDSSELIGKTIVKIIGTQGAAELIFICEDGSKYKMFHYQDCCEHVYLEDANNLEAMLNSPITKVEIVTSDENPPGIEKDYQDCFLWTFYHFATANGSTTLRWYGISNGYYSVGVDFERLEEGEDDYELS